ncbi:hypothetical protein AVEN_81502-1 [Araneus ventricosus]|uniref:Uncharacterized protein n=1 Tax=Araneus ventricosus TaxID=182803 RepID=A0A4Y2E3Y1_ARAVE|nr:hypothetical protein AVEN_81502-1 [Araneus ventricosus]
MIYAVIPNNTYCNCTNCRGCNAQLVATYQRRPLPLRYEGKVRKQLYGQVICDSSALQECGSDVSFTPERTADPDLKSE